MPSTITVPDIDFEYGDEVRDESDIVLTEAISSMRTFNFMEQLDVSRWRLIKRYKINKAIKFLYMCELTKDTLEPGAMLAYLSDGQRGRVHKVAKETGRG